MGIHKEIRGAMTRFEPLTEQALQERGLESITLAELEQALAQQGLSLEHVVHDPGRSFQNTFYAKYLESQSWVESYEAGAALSEELYCHVSSVGIRGLYFRTSWESDFLLHFADGRRGIRELVREDALQKASTVERLEFSRRYWAATNIDEWKVVLLPRQ